MSPLIRYKTSLSIYTVNGSDVYLAGGENNGSNGTAKLWKNGVMTNLTDDTNDALYIMFF
jgi:hypothetical protein